ncbi:hypothetical protein [Zhihengliuella flava]|uniref:Clp R domain-containing protein n=1 Tax=Zhihengliuella flava TaxID=1285193 RepID=A0A931D9W4_9MICC|nr:hypothetical protein [Zhihengliuella flava]MBG6085117.1 hypothetical protein [Zhihengliuella flava]
MLGAIHHDPEVAAALSAAGADVAALKTALCDRIDAEAGLDASALAEWGIDLAAVSAAADQAFGDGALRRAGALVRQRQRRKPGLGELAHATLMAARGEAVRLAQMPIGGRHVLLGALLTSAQTAELLEDSAQRTRLRQALEAPGAS